MVPGHEPSLSRNRGTTVRPGAHGGYLRGGPGDGAGRAALRIEHSESTRNGDPFLRTQHPDAAVV